ncbi:MAG TPA: PAS domain S-box protein, partial [Thermoanaerobaculia bacterium]|nr:PAS domain S-box protein [Thermoanaerobaculia bacterium]
GKTLPAAGSDEAEVGTTDQDVRHLEEELRRTQEELQSTIEELETSNEEVLSVNEELQSANEELEASKAELETLNEELAAANAELQETNMALRRSEEMLRRVTDALPVLISYVGADGRFRMMNATYEEWFGRPRAEIEGRTVEEVLGEETWAKTGPAMKRALAGEESEFEGELDVGVKGPRYVSVLRVPHRDELGRVRGVFNLITDLTEREAARRELARLAAIVRTSNDAIISKDLNNVITTWNRGAEKIFGWSAEEAVGQSIQIIIPEEKRDEPEEIIETVRRGGEVRQRETVRLRKDGRRVDISVTASPILDEEGQVMGASVIDRDITVRKRAEAALRASEERYREKARALAEADRRKDEFLAMLGHELRNPLSPIRNAVEMLREHGAELDPEKAKRAVGIVSRQLDQLTRLVDDLLDVARITRGQIRLDVRPVRLASVLERAVETARPLFEERDHRFRLALPEGEVWVEADPDRLAQAVGNLLHNAAKFTPEGGEVSVEVERDG